MTRGWRLALVLFVVFGQLAFIAHAAAINEPDLEVDTSDVQASGAHLITAEDPAIDAAAASAGDESASADTEETEVELPDGQQEAEEETESEEGDQEGDDAVDDGKEGAEKKSAAKKTKTGAAGSKATQQGATGSKTKQPGVVGSPQPKRPSSRSPKSTTSASTSSIPKAKVAGASGKVARATAAVQKAQVKSSQAAARSSAADGKAAAAARKAKVIASNAAAGVATPAEVAAAKAAAARAAGLAKNAAAEKAAARKVAEKQAAAKARALKDKAAQHAVDSTKTALKSVSQSKQVGAMRDKAATAGAKYTKKVMKSASPQVANALGGLGFNKDQLQAKAMQKIEDCVARQRGPLQLACRALQRGITLGQSSAAFQDINLDLAERKLTGLMDMSRVFPGMTSVAFDVDFDGGPTITFSGGKKSFPKVTLAQFVQKLTGSNIEGDGMERAVINALKLDQLTFKLKSLTLSLNPMAVSVKATLGIFGLQLDFSVYAGKVGGGFGLAFVVAITKRHINEFKSKAFPGAMKGAVDAFAFSSMNLIFSTRRIDFSSHPSLNVLPQDSILKRGFAFRMNMKFDKQSPNKMAQTVGKNLKNELALQLLVSSDRMSLDLLLPDFPLGKKARMTANALSVVYKMPASLSMEITSTFLFKVKDTELGFTATLALVILPTPGLTLSVLLVGTWREAFGIKPLTVTALSGSITVVPVAPFIKAFEFNAAIELGVVKFAAGIGMDLTNPKAMFFYAKCDKLTIGNVVGAFKPSLKLPAFLADTGFDYADISFTLSPNGAVSMTQVVIPAGFRAKGKLNLFGWKVVADIVIGPKEFKFYAAFDPVRFCNDLIALTRSKAEMDKGALIDIYFPFTKMKNFKLNIDGYAKFFLFEAEVHIAINAVQMTIDATVQLMIIFTAKIHIAAQFGPPQPGTSAALGSGGKGFSLRVSLSMEKFLKSMQDFFQGIQKAVNWAFDQANKALNRAKDSLEQAKCNINRDCGWCHLEMSAYAGVLDQFHNGSTNTNAVSLVELHALHQHVAYRMSMMQLEDMEAHGLIATEEEHWTPEKEARVNRRLQIEAHAHRARVEQERREEERQRYAAANRTFTATPSTPASNTSFGRVEMASMIGLETLAVHRDNLRAGQDSAARSMEELDALLDDEPAGFVDPRTPAEIDEDRHQALLELDQYEELMENRYNVDLEAHEAHHIVEDIQNRREAAGKAPAFEDEDYKELEARFMKQRADNMPELKQRHARRRARQYKEVAMAAHKKLLANGHRHLREMDTASLRKLAEHSTQDHAERHAKLLQQKATTGTHDVEEHSKSHRAKLAELMHHHTLDHAYDDTAGHQAVEDSAERLLMELHQTSHHEHHIADKTHAMVHSMLAHREHHDATTHHLKQLYHTREAILQANLDPNVLLIEMTAGSIEAEAAKFTLDVEQHTAHTAHHASVHLMHQHLEEYAKLPSPSPQQTTSRAELELAVDGVKLPSFVQMDSRFLLHSNIHGAEILPEPWQHELHAHNFMFQTPQVQQYITHRSELEIKRRQIQRLRTDPDQVILVETLSAQEHKAYAQLHELHAVAMAELQDTVAVDAEAQSRTQSTSEAWRGQHNAEGQRMLNKYWYTGVAINYLTARITDEKLRKKHFDRMLQLKIKDCGYELLSNDTKTGPVYGVRPPKSLFVYDQNPPAGISREQWAQEHADAIEEWKDRNLCPHDYTPCPFDVEGCTMEDDKLALQIHRVKVAKAKFVAPFFSPGMAEWEGGYTIYVLTCWAAHSKDVKAMLECTREQARFYLANQPQANPNPVLPSRNLNWFQRIGCEIRRGFCIIGCTIKNVILMICQAILSAVQGVLAAIQWIINVMLDIIQKIVKGLRLEISFGTTITEKSFEFDLSFFFQLFPGLKLDFGLSLSLQTESFTSMLKHFILKGIEWLKSKFGGHTKAVEDKNPALKETLNQKFAANLKPRSLATAGDKTGETGKATKDAKAPAKAAAKAPAKAPAKTPAKAPARPKKAGVRLETELALELDDDAALSPPTPAPASLSLEDAIARAVLPTRDPVVVHQELQQAQLRFYQAQAAAEAAKLEKQYESVQADIQTSQAAVVTAKRQVQATEGALEQATANFEQSSTPANKQALAQAQYALLTARGALKSAGRDVRVLEVQFNQLWAQRAARHKTDQANAVVAANAAAAAVALRKEISAVKESISAATSLKDVDPASEEGQEALATMLEANERERVMHMATKVAQSKEVVAAAALAQTQAQQTLSQAMQASVAAQADVNRARAYMAALNTTSARQLPAVAQAAMAKATAANKAAMDHAEKTTATVGAARLQLRKVSAETEVSRTVHQLTVQRSALTVAKVDALQCARKAREAERAYRVAKAKNATAQVIDENRATWNEAKDQLARARAHVTSVQGRVDTAKALVANIKQAARAAEAAVVNAQTKQSQSRTLDLAVQAAVAVRKAEEAQVAAQEAFTTAEQAYHKQPTAQNRALASAARKEMEVVSHALKSAKDRAAETEAQAVQSEERFRRAQVQSTSAPTPARA